MKPLVMKFGGSSLSTPERRQNVCELIQSQDRPVLVVVSAQGDTTDHLLRAAHLAKENDLEQALSLVRQALGDLRLPQDEQPLWSQAASLLQGMACLNELSLSGLDRLLAFGELKSSFEISQNLAPDCGWLDARCVVFTDNQSGNAQPKLSQIAKACQSNLLLQFEQFPIVVTQGFIGCDNNGRTTTLGRGGSDYSAALLANAVGARELQIWTDVPGILTSDPRIVEGAEPIPILSFREAAELAAFGAKVLHPRTIQPAKDAGIPVSVRSTFDPNGSFTRIQEGTSQGMAAVASRGPISILTLESNRMLNQPGFLAKVFSLFAAHKVSVDLVTTAEVSVSVSLEPGGNVDDLLHDLSEFCKVQRSDHLAMVSLIGEGLRRLKNPVPRVFSALEDIPIHMISLGASEINLTVVVDTCQRELTVCRLHDAWIRTRGEVSV